MKSLIAAFLIVTGLWVLAALGQTQHAQAGYWTKLSGMFAKTVPSKLYAIEAQGFNIRGYLYYLPAFNRVCNFNATDGGSGGLDCWEVEGAHQQKFIKENLK